MERLDVAVGPRHLLDLEQNRFDKIDVDQRSLIDKHRTELATTVGGQTFRFGRGQGSTRQTRQYYQPAANHPRHSNPQRSGGLRAVHR